jgi:hypothetical protein
MTMWDIQTLISKPTAAKEFTYVELLPPQTLWVHLDLKQVYGGS